MARNLKKKRRDKGRSRGQPIVDSVLAEALKELSLHGADGFSIERVAEAAEVNKTSVYRRWPSKAALLTAALVHLQKEAALDLPDTGSFRGDLTAMGHAVGAIVTSIAGRGLFRAVIAAGEIPELAAFAQQQIAAGIVGPAGMMISRARLRGELSDGVKPEMILTVLAGAVIHRIYLEQQDVTPEWLASLVDMLFRGIEDKPL